MCTAVYLKVFVIYTDFYESYHVSGTNTHLVYSPSKVLIFLIAVVVTSLFLLNTSDKYPENIVTTAKNTYGIDEYKPFWEIE